MKLLRHWVQGEVGNLAQHIVEILVVPINGCGIDTERFGQRSKAERFKAVLTDEIGGLNCDRFTAQSSALGFDGRHVRRVLRLRVMQSAARDDADERKDRVSPRLESMPTVASYALHAVDGSFERTMIERREVGPHDVNIAIAYAGICHSDIHTGRGEWGTVPYPQVTGHEIAGFVESVGSEVTKFAVGDRVGVGCLVDSCRECAHCKAGNEMFCKGSVGTYNDTDRYGEQTQGGYSTHIVVDENYVLSIPESLSLDVAAPLLCAGITLYSPIANWNVGPGTRVAVAGLGGLGHMGVKIAAAKGAEVTVLTRSEAKAADALRLGAHHALATNDPDVFKNNAGSFDLILNSISAAINLGDYLRLLDAGGTMVYVGAPEHPMPLDIGNLIMGNRGLAGSNIGGIKQTQEMLDFCAEHGFGSDIEVISAQQIDEAWDRVVAGDVRYRFVIDNSTI